MSGPTDPSFLGAVGPYQGGDDGSGEAVAKGGGAGGHTSLPQDRLPGDRKHDYCVVGCAAVVLPYLPTIVRHRGHTAVPGVI
jgi:hypothetical protein